MLQVFAKIAPEFQKILVSTLFDPKIFQKQFLQDYRILI